MPFLCGPLLALWIYPFTDLKTSPQPKVKHPAYKGLRATLVSILVSVGLVIVKGTAGILGNSYALVADAIESASDVFSSLILFAGLRIAAKAPDVDHPYGHGKAEPLAATIIGLTMGAAAILIVVESVSNILTPHLPPKVFTLWVLGTVIFVKEILFRFVIKVAQEADSTAVKADAWHHRSDAITSAAAFVGIAIAIVGGEGYEVADDYAALVAAGIVMINAYKVFRPALNEVMDAAPSQQLVQEVKTLAAQVAGALDVPCIAQVEREQDLPLLRALGVTAARGRVMAPEWDADQLAAAAAERRRATPPRP